MERWWYYLIPVVLIILSAGSTLRHNRDAARKGKNPIDIHISFGRNPFRKRPETTYTEDKKINRYWEP